MRFYKTKHFKIFVSVLITAGFVLFLYYFIDFKFFFSYLKNANLSVLLISALFLFASHVFRAMRFEIVLQESQRIKLISISAIHFFLNKILPFRSGEISQPILFNKHLNISYQKGITALIFFRLLDALSMTFIFLCSVFIIKAVSLDMFFYVSIFGIIGIVCFWIFFEKICQIIKHIIDRLMPITFKKAKAGLADTIEKIVLYKKNKSSLFFLKTLIVSISSWLCTYFYYYFIIKAFLFDFNYFETVFATTISNFTFILPISGIGNIGPFEAGWAAGFFLLGVSKQISIPVGLFANLFATLLTAALAGLGVFALRRNNNIQDRI